MYRFVMRFTVADLAAALTARDLQGRVSRLVGPDVVVDGATFDSRDVRPGQLFVPLVAERDGHDFIGDALAAGATAYLTSRPDVIERFGGSAVLVPDTAEALIDAAGWVRTLFPASTVVVGVTGSVGKTTTKDLVAAAVSSELSTTANVRSFNNEQGLPVTILNASADTRVLVLEMGMRGFGQIADLCRIARPSIGVVTRVGEAHTELVGGIEGVARAKGELVEALPPQGYAVLNADDDRVRSMAHRTSAPVISFGEAVDADVRIDGLRLDDSGCASFRLVTKDESIPIRLLIPGRHTAANAAAAFAVGRALGVSSGAMAEALGRATVSERRMQMRRTRSGATLIDDSYNANPTSMEAALRTLADLRADRRVAVLGVMAEIDDVEGGHARMRELADELGIETVAVGTPHYGIAPVSLEEAIDLVAGFDSGVAVLVKASRSAGLDRVVDAVV